jgi:hypothetical protein
MSTHESLQALKAFVIEHGLPKSDMALFGTKCPYCGKTDRIRRLEDPSDLLGRIEPHGLESYRELWKNLSLPEGSLGVCKFCHNLLEIVHGQSEGKVLSESGSGEVKE